MSWPSDHIDRLTHGGSFENAGITMNVGKATTRETFTANQLEDMGPPGVNDNGTRFSLKTYRIAVAFFISLC